MSPKYSIVIPLKDEQDNLVPLIEELEPVMVGLKAPWELICIDDGSKDATRSILEGLAQKKEYLRLLVFDRNYGQSSGFDAGFQAARGEYVITMDGDRQNDPADIPQLLQAMEGYDLVCGRRVNRRDTAWKRVVSLLANKVRGRLCGDGMHDTGCSLKVYRTSCLRRITLYQGMHRFLPALFSIQGFRTKEIPVNHRPRTSGKTKYHFFNRSFNTLFDLFAVMWMRKRHLHYKVDREIP